MTKPSFHIFPLHLNSSTNTHTISIYIHRLLINKTFIASLHGLQPEPSHFYQGASSDVLSAHNLFDEMPELGVMSATSMIGQLARQHQFRKATCLFSRMLLLGIRPNEFTFGTLIPMSNAAGDLDLGRQFHGCAVKIGLRNNVFVGTAVLDVYSKLGSIGDAHRAFNDIGELNVVSYTSLIRGYLKNERYLEALQLFWGMPERNVISWNAMIGGYSQKGQNEEAVNFFIEMLKEGLIPNQSTFPCVISAASNIAALGIGRSLHASAIKNLGKLNVFVVNSVVSFYAKCGNMEDSLLAFDRLPERNIISWNAVICGFAQNGKGEDAVKFFEKMRATGLRPNGVSLLGLLLACTHSGLVDKGYLYFNQARLENPEILEPEHYACVVDLLSRCGRLKEAQEFLRDLPFVPGIGFWKALLAGCQIHSNTGLAELAARKILESDPGDVSSYVMLSNAHSAAGSWKVVSRIRREMKDKGMKRIPGCSWIEIGSKVHVFVNSDRSHFQKEEIFAVLKFLYGAFEGD